MSALHSGTTTPAPEHISRQERDQLVAVQREAFRAEGDPTAEVRRHRIDRLVLAILDADDIAAALAEDYGRRPSTPAKASEILGLVEEARAKTTKLADRGWLYKRPDGRFTARAQA
jgi:coniferyl-aldehyde dehydrogenase